jgi:hypothetical protein
LALCSTLARRARVVPPAGLADAARSAAEALHGPMRSLTLELSRALVEKRLSDAHKAREQGQVVLAALAERQAVARWASGEPFEVLVPSMPELIAEAWLDCLEELDGVPPENSWRLRRAQQRQLAEYSSRMARATGAV